MNYQNAIHPDRQAKGLLALKQWLKLVEEQYIHPYQFEIYHSALRAPFDYYQFGLDLIEPLVDFDRSQLFGMDNLKQIKEEVGKGDNVILLANHQTEPDPQAITLLLQNAGFGDLAEQMIFVAGHRVVTDPMAIPFSLGRNLLCIYSKKYIETPPQEKEKKILHNQRTLKKMKELLNEGGKCIYVAPSGGRDRKNREGELILAPLLPESIELFWLLAQQAARPTHFYPLALKTYDLMPPPSDTIHDAGEERKVSFTPIYLNFAPEIHFHPERETAVIDKKQRRIQRAEEIWSRLASAYEIFA